MGDTELVFRRGIRIERIEHARDLDAAGIHDGTVGCVTRDGDLSRQNLGGLGRRVFRDAECEVALEMREFGQDGLGQTRRVNAQCDGLATGKVLRIDAESALRRPVEPILALGCVVLGWPCDQVGGQPVSLRRSEVGGDSCFGGRDGHGVIFNAVGDGGLDAVARNGERHVLAT